MIKPEDIILDVVQAYKDGKKIEMRLKNGPGNTWGECKEPQWDFVNFEYRIKPEPKYRECKSIGEAIALINKHGSWIMTKDKKYFYQIVGFQETFVLIGQDGLREFSKVFDDFVFTDGTPFGIIIEK